MDNHNTLEFQPRNIRRQARLRVLTPDHDPRFKSEHD